jgi:hypothetical protein
LLVIVSWKALAPDLFARPRELATSVMSQQRLLSNANEEEVYGVGVAYQVARLLPDIAFRTYPTK